MVILRGVEWVAGPGMLGPAFADTALSLTRVFLVVLMGEKGFLVAFVLVESEAAAKPCSSSFVLGVI